MDNARRILKRLDELVDCPAEITLYGRAALHLGFSNPLPEHARSLDVDVVLWLGQAEELAAAGNFWDALAQLNREFDADGLYLSHLFDEDQVVLSPHWRDRRVAIDMPMTHLRLARLADPDLALSKLMRYDPTDLTDLLFIVSAGNLSAEVMRLEMDAARIPDIPEIREQFELCRRWLERQYAQAAVNREDE